jgi:hypothetical protein
MKVYKLTGADGYTRNRTLWGENVTHTAKYKSSSVLCSNSWIHFYVDPNVAVLMNSVHVDFVNPLLWEAETGGEILLEPLKGGSKSLTTIKQIPLPQITDAQKVAFAILCAMEVYKGEKWTKWAQSWLDGSDRSSNSAANAAATANSVAYAAYADYAAHAAYIAANAVANAYTTYVTASAAYAAASNAAYIVATANAYTTYVAAANINFIELAQKALAYN